MAVDSSRLGNKIVNDLRSAGFYPATDAARVARSISEWTVIANAILSELKINMEIDLTAGDIFVDAGTFTTANGAVSGIGISEAANLMGKLK